MSKSLLDLDDELEEDDVPTDPEPEAEYEDYATEEDDEISDEAIDDLKGDIDEVLPNGDIRVGNKIYKPHQLRPGNKIAMEGVKARKAIARRETAPYDMETERTRIFKPKDIKEVRKWAKTYGISRMLRIMQNQCDSDFAKTFIAMMPYMLPKLNSIDVKQSDDIIKTGGEEDMHTIVVKDMTGGRVQKTTFQDE